MLNNFLQLGSDTKIVDEVSDNWWQTGFNSALGSVKKKKKKKRKAESDNEEASNEPTFDDLFKATGGARLGMRARAKQLGKIKRTEGDKSNA
jgi:hypothetical protein